MNGSRTTLALRLIAAVGALGICAVAQAGPDTGTTHQPVGTGTIKPGAAHNAGPANPVNPDTLPAPTPVTGGKFDPTGGIGYPIDDEGEVRGGEPYDTCTTAPLRPTNSVTMINNTNASTSANDPAQCRFGGGTGFGSCWIKFTATATSIRARTCSSTGAADDSILSIYSGTCGSFTMLGCNEDFCGTSGLLSKVDVAGLTVGTTYYVMLTSYSINDRGTYTVELISPIPQETCGDCPPGAHPRPEPDCSNGYVDMTNGGCNSTPPVFQNVACGETICGRSGTFTAAGGGATRDTDWYKLVLAVDTQVTLEATAEFPSLIGVVNTNGIDSCSGITGFRVNATAAPCNVATTIPTCLPAGTWYVFVAPADFTNAPCQLNLDYFLTVTCEACTPPPECPCPKGAQPEPILDNSPGPEPGCGIPVDLFNGGCNSVPPVFGNVECGVDYFGNGSFDGANRDTDWFRLTTTQPLSVTMTVTSEFHAVIGELVGAFPVGQPSCDQVQGISPFAITDPCSETTLTMNLPVAGEYWFFVGADFDSGFVACPADNSNYCLRFDCVPTKPPCEIVIPPNAIAETDDAGNPVGEPDCGIPEDTFNGGCNSTPPVFSAAECGDVIHGTGSFTGTNRDTDWFQLSLKAQTRVTLQVNAEFAAVFGLIAGDFPTGQPDCSQITAINPVNVTDPCTAANISICLEAGTYWFFVGADFNGDPFPCGSDYVATFTCGSCSTCAVACPPGSSQEGEADCGLPTDTSNGGCNTNPPLFGEIACNQTVCGTTANDGQTRDTDWYSFNVTTGASVTVSVAAEFSGTVLIVNNDCGNLLGFAAVDFTDNCTGTATAPVVLDPGTYNVVVVSSFTSGTVACGADYTVTLTGDCGGGGADCNNNGVPDSQDISSGTSADCFNYGAAPIDGVFVAGGANGIPDECECIADWDRNGVANSTDVSELINTYFYDQVHGTIYADVDCNGVSNSTDVSNFINVWFSAQAGQLPFAGCAL
jgi:hypothetical protein